MERKSAGGAIRLTNKTAIALRESARTVRRTGVVVGAAVTVAFAVAAVWCGMRWLPAVPLLIGAAVAIDALIALHARQTYLLLTGQAGQCVAIQIQENRVQLLVSDGETMLSGA